MIQTRSAQRSQTLLSTSRRRRRSTSEKSLLRQSGTQCLCSLSLSIPRELRMFCGTDCILGCAEVSWLLKH